MCTTKLVALCSAKQEPLLASHQTLLLYSMVILHMFMVSVGNSSFQNSQND